MYTRTLRPKKKLRHVIQEDNETFESFADRWRSTLARMDTPPSEEQQIELMRENLNAKYTVAIASKSFSRMEKLTKVGLSFDEAFEKEKGKAGVIMPYVPNKQYPSRKGKAEVHYIANAWVAEKEKRSKRPPRHERKVYENVKPARHYDDYGMPLIDAFKIMIEKKLIVPLDKPKDEKPMGTRTHQWCLYHQVRGHHTNFC